MRVAFHHRNRNGMVSEEAVFKKGWSLMRVVFHHRNRNGMVSEEIVFKEGWSLIRLVFHDRFSCTGTSVSNVVTCSLWNALFTAWQDEWLVHKTGTYRSCYFALDLSQQLSHVLVVNATENTSTADYSFIDKLQRLFRTLCLQRANIMLDLWRTDHNGSQLNKRIVCICVC